MVIFNTEELNGYILRDFEGNISLSLNCPVPKNNVDGIILFLFNLLKLFFNKLDLLKNLLKSKSLIYSFIN